MDEKRKSQGIFLGYPFDQLFSQKCPLKGTKEEILPAIILPDEKAQDDSSTGNIVICGKPGTGKSTLAMQFASACILNPLNFNPKDNLFSAYISLEEPKERVMAKARAFYGKKANLFRELCHLHDVSESESTEKLGEILYRILSQPDKCLFITSKKSDDRKCQKIHAEAPAKSCVLLPMLAPRPIIDAESPHSLFLERYAQLEKFLVAARNLPKDKNHPKLALVCIDSLNMFGAQPLKREELYRLFDLFHRNYIIGVFVVEDSYETPFDSTMADVVIGLYAEKDQGYFVRYLEILKSRSYPSVYGRHLFKTMSLDELPIGKNKMQLFNETGRPLSGIIAYPSLHYIISTMESSRDQLDWDGRFSFGVNALNNILPRNLMRREVVTIKGPQGTLKSTLAGNFIAVGLIGLKTKFNKIKGEYSLVEKERESALYIYLDAPPPESKSKPYNRYPTSKELADKNPWQDFLLVKLPQFALLKKSQKVHINVWERVNGKKQRFIEVYYKSGAIFPEEFIQIVRDILDGNDDDKNAFPINRVVLDDVSRIGVSFPFLHYSNTTGDSFLARFVDIMRKRIMDLVITATTSELPSANDQVNRACALADSVLSCDFCNVFGDRYITITGSGLLAVQGMKTAERVPAVMRIIGRKGDERENGSTFETDEFEADETYLEGLVGFEKDTIHRPGLVMHIFQQNEGVQKNYNEQVAAMVEALFTSQEGISRSQGEATISKSEHPSEENATAMFHLEGHTNVIAFRPDKSDAIHDSIRLLTGKPLDKTVLYTVDEFYAVKNNLSKTEMAFCDIPFYKNHKDKDFIGANRNPQFLRRYYANVLLLAYRKGCLDGAIDDEIDKTKRIPVYKRAKTWQGINECAKKIKHKDDSGDIPGINRAFWFSQTCSETLSCALLDAWLGKACWDSFANKDIIPYSELKDAMGKALCASIPSICSLSELFWQTKRFDNKKDSEIDNMPPDAGIYLCWYSQLRELIYQKSTLADELEVCALPNGGFNGDWFMGVARGSVSTKLGVDIMNVFCGEQESYKRFVAGVGLPVHKNFYKKNQNIPAWPCAPNTLREILGIYKNAASRSKIEGYVSFRSALSMICKQLTPLSGLGKPYNEDEIENLVKALPKRIDLLYPQELRNEKPKVVINPQPTQNIT